MVTLANPRWLGPADPAVLVSPVSGTYLVLDLSVTLDEGAFASASSLILRNGNWFFTPDGDPVPGTLSLVNSDGSVLATWPVPPT